MTLWPPASIYLLALCYHSRIVVRTFVCSQLHRVMQRRSPAARAFNSVATGARTNSKSASSELEDRASLIAFAWNIRGNVS
jgi:hypothetical protein